MTGSGTLTGYPTVRPGWENNDMSSQILTVASAMFMIPIILLIGVAIVGEIPEWMLFIGGWSMAFGVIVGALGVFVGMNEG